MHAEASSCSRLSAPRRARANTQEQASQQQALDAQQAAAHQQASDKDMAQRAALKHFMDMAAANQQAASQPASLQQGWLPQVPQQPNVPQQLAIAQAVQQQMEQQQELQRWFPPMWKAFNNATTADAAASGAAAPGPAAQNGVPGFPQQTFGALQWPNEQGMPQMFPGMYAPGLWPGVPPQYALQLAQYAEQQREFAQWADRYRTYEQAYVPQGSFAPSSPPIAGPSPSALLQTPPKAPITPTGVAPTAGAIASTPSHRHDGLRKGRALVQMEASAQSAAALAKKEASLKHLEAMLTAKQEKMRKEELGDKREEAELNQREQALVMKERQVNEFQHELVREQQKIWKVLRSRSVNAAQGRAAAVASTPSPPPLAAPAQQSEQPQPAGGVAPWAAQTPPLPATVPASAPSLPAAAPQQSPAALPQMRARAPRRLRGGASRQVRGRRGAVLAQTSVASRGGQRGTTQAVRGSGSDLQLVVASQKPADAYNDEDSTPSSDRRFDDEDDSSGRSNQVTSDEDSAPLRREDRRGAFADNDDLEVLLQKSARLRHFGDAVELGNEASKGRTPTPA